MNAKQLCGTSYLGSINASSKIEKNAKVHMIDTYVLYLAPARESGYQVCPMSTPECRMGCLATSGRAAIEIAAGGDRIKSARIRKTRAFFEQRDAFMRVLVAEIAAAKKRSERKGNGFSVRLNGTSDIAWEAVKIDGKTIFEIFGDVQFYDYTKIPKRVSGNKFPNYHLTFSFTGYNWPVCEKLLEAGKNVAVVFSKALPQEWNGFPVVNGDLSDYRPLDPAGVIVGLKWKRIANKERNMAISRSAFVAQAA